MPVTKTAKRALRGSKKKALVNSLTTTKLEAAIRVAKKSKNREKILAAITLLDRTAKKKVIHKNKAARIKSTLSKLMPKEKQKSPKKRTVKKSSKK